MIGAADLASGEIRGTADLSVCFADLVEFTRLGEEIAAEELGSVAGRFEEMASAVAEPPVRLVKMIGDAAMLVSPEPEPMLEAALRLIEAADEEGDEFPFLRAGLALGPTLAQAGDYYGRAVNLASRITGVARPGSVLVDAATKEAVGERLRLLLRRRAPAEGHRLRASSSSAPGACATARTSATRPACGR